LTPGGDKIPGLNISSQHTSDYPLPLPSNGQNQKSIRTKGCGGDHPQLLTAFLFLSQFHIQGTQALVTFVTAGYPTPQDTVPILLALQEGGADIIELGVPFSDPMADGPAIQETNNVCSC
jgi:Tryptophan synthase alpha chain